MPKPKRNISSNALLRRHEFLTGGMESQSEETEASEEQETVDTQATVERQATPEALQEVPPVSKDTPDQIIEQQEPVQEQSAPPQALSKKQILQQYLKTKHGDIEMDTIYFPSELYQAFRNVWSERKKKQRGFKKSYIVIEALLRHPEIIEELQKQGMLKE